MGQTNIETTLERIAQGIAPGGLAGSGFTASALFTPAAAAYGAGDIMNVPKEFSFVDRNGLAIPVGSLIRILSTAMKIDITAVPTGQTSYTGRLYSVTPPSAQADNDAWTLVTGDLSSYRGPIALGTPVDEGSCLYIKSQYVDTDLKLAADKSSLFMELITDGAHTAAAIARQVFLYGVVL